METKRKDYTYEVWTIPNIFTLFRLILVPVFVLFYCGLNMPYTALIFFIISGISDLVDGFIARKFKMTSELGRLVDPIADKFTQGVAFICLMVRFKYIIILAIILCLKELVLAISGAKLTNKCEKIYGAEWYGKVNSSLLFITLLTHLLWVKLPQNVSLVLVIISSIMMIYSGVRYLIRNTKLIRSANGEQ